MDTNYDKAEEGQVSHPPKGAGKQMQNFSQSSLFISVYSRPFAVLNCIVMGKL
jgi:hypothetical protein